MSEPIPYPPPSLKVIVSKEGSCVGTYSQCADPVPISTFESAAEVQILHRGQHFVIHENEDGDGLQIGSVNNGHVVDFKVEPTTLEPVVSVRPNG